MATVKQCLINGRVRNRLTLRKQQHAVKCAPAGSVSTSILFKSYVHNGISPAICHSPGATYIIENIVDGDAADFRFVLDIRRPDDFQNHVSRSTLMTPKGGLLTFIQAIFFHTIHVLDLCAMSGDCVNERLVRKTVCRSAMPKGTLTMEDKMVARSCIGHKRLHGHQLLTARQVSCDHVHLFINGRLTIFFLVG